MFNLLKRRTKNTKGFTLIELIVVIAILGILAAIAVPRLGGFSESAKMATDEQLGAQVANAAKMYAAANPTATTITFANLKAADLIDDALVDGSDAFVAAKLVSTNYTNMTLAFDRPTEVVTVTLVGTVSKTITK